MRIYTVLRSPLRTTILSLTTQSWQEECLIKLSQANHSTFGSLTRMLFRYLGEIGHLGSIDTCIHHCNNWIDDITDSNE